jgi:hypothetical protein
MNKKDWEKALEELENNDQAISTMADEIFGTVKELTKVQNKCNEQLLNERTVFYREGLRFLNQLSLKDF